MMPLLRSLFLYAVGVWMLAEWSISPGPTPSVLVGASILIVQALWPEGEE